METAGFWEVFLENLYATTWLEGVAVLFGLLSVWYARKAHILVYPTGIVSVLIYVYICYFAGLYADMGINAFYFWMSVYGWYFWTRKDSTKKLPPVAAAKSWENLASISIALILFLILRFLLSNYTDSTVPNWDSITTAIFIVGMWMMARKKIENWLWWIAGDLISIPLYFHKDLVLTSFQFTVFLVIAVMGYIEWKKMIRERGIAE